MSDMALTEWQRNPVRPLAPRTILRWLAQPLALAVTRPLLAAVGLTVLLAGLVIAWLPSSTNPPAPARSATPAPAAAWIDIVKPIEIFSLEAVDFGKGGKTYQARRNPAGGGRQDTLAFGSPGPGPSLRLQLYRRGAEAYAPRPLFAEVARQAAEAGFALGRSSLPDELPTRFGPFQVIDVAVRAGAGPALPCSGFRLALDAPALTITGLACGGGTPMSRARLGCLLERLDVASGGADPALVEFFARSELTRNGGCAGMRLGPDGLHAPWLDDQAATPRKNKRRR